MMSTNVAKVAVFEAAKALVAAGKSPTLAEIRAYLGHGSQSTLHKYLNQWKWACFQKGAWEVDTVDYQGLIAAKNALEKTISYQTEQNTRLTAQLIEAEQHIMLLNPKLKQLETDQQLSQEQAKNQAADYKALELAFEALKENQDNALNAIFKDKNQQINTLMAELKALNEATLKVVTNQGYQADDLLMQEKVLNLNLKQKIEDLEKTLKDLHTQLIRISQTEQTLKTILERQRKQIATFEQGQVYKSAKEE